MLFMYLRTDILYSRLYAYEDDELEVKRLPRIISCILIACIDYILHAANR